MVLRSSSILICLLVSLSSCEDGSDATNNVNDTVPVGYGKELYTNNCLACHGEAGDLGAGGASDLITSKLEGSDVAKVIEKGRKGMPPHSHVYSSSAELDSLVVYVLTLRK